MSIWPPAVLFDAVYASAVLHRFGFAAADISEKWGDMFYPGGPTNAADRRRRDQRDQADADKENSSRKISARQQRYERRDGRRGIDPYDLIMMYRCQAMEPEKVRAYLRGSEEIVAARERKGLEEKVNSWRESLAPLTANDTD